MARGSSGAGLVLQHRMARGDIYAVAAATARPAREDYIYITFRIRTRIRIRIRICIRIRSCFRACFHVRIQIRHLNGQPIANNNVHNDNGYDEGSVPLN